MGRRHTDDEVRAEFTREVMRELAVNGRIREMRVRDSEGRAPLVFALDHELLSAVIGRVVIAGGAANTFVQINEHIALVELRMSEDAEPIGADLGPEPIHQDISIGMFVAAARAFPDGIVARITLPSYSASAEVRELVSQ